MLFKIDRILTFCGSSASGQIEKCLKLTLENVFSKNK